MRHLNRTLAALAILLTLSAWAHAADAPAGPDAAIAPFVDGQTIVIVRGDIGAVDLKAVRAWVENTIKTGDMDDESKAAALKSLPDIQTTAQTWIDQFKQAGGRQIYIELNLADMQDGPAFIVPLGEGADSAAMENLFATGDSKKPLNEKEDGNQFAISNGCMLFSQDTVLAKILKRPPAARPDIAKVLAEPGDVPVRMALVATDDALASMQQMAPNLPEEMGGGKTADLIGSLTSGWLSLSMAPAPSLKMILHYKDADSAKTAAAGMDVIHSAMEKLMQVRGGQGGPDAVPANIVGLLAPTADGDKLTLTVDDKKLNSAMNNVCMGIFQSAVMAKRVQSSSNLRQIGQAVMLYTNDSKGPYPADLAALLKSEEIIPQVFINPQTGNEVPKNWQDMKPEEQAKWVNEQSDYVYLGAGLKQGVDPTIVVAHERQTPKTAAGINLLFADGHVEFQKADEAKKTLENSKAVREKP